MTYEEHDFLVNLRASILRGYLTQEERKARKAIQAFFNVYQRLLLAEILQKRRLHREKFGF